MEMGLAQYLRERMQERGWSKADLARHIGVDASLVSRWLAGDQPRPETCHKIAAAFGLEPETVLRMARHLSGPVELPAPPADPDLEMALAEVREILARRRPEQRRPILEVVRVLGRYNPKQQFSIKRPSLTERRGISLASA